MIVDLKINDPTVYAAVDSNEIGLLPSFTPVVCIAFSSGNTTGIFGCPKLTANLTFELRAYPLNPSTMPVLDTVPFIAGPPPHVIEPLTDKP